MAEQQGDVLLEQTNDNGEITVEGGVVSMAGGLQTAAYLSLFGGNEQDDGRPDNALQWWGNLSETQAENQYRSRLQYLLRSIPSIPANLRRLEDAADADLAWMVETGAARTVSVAASMPALNRVRLVVTVNGGQDLTYIENWKADA
ncbi:phage GP46 family protein [bacterium]|nr:phage GP46 family protein [bacterium]